jgi:hypothetical protein
MNPTGIIWIVGVFLVALPLACFVVVKAVTWLTQVIEKRAAYSVVVKCPHCGLEGNLNPRKPAQLGRFACKNCQRNFCLDRHGKSAKSLSRVLGLPLLGGVAGLGCVFGYGYYAGVLEQAWPVLLAAAMSQPVLWFWQVARPKPFPVRDELAEAIRN